MSSFILPVSFTVLTRDHKTVPDLFMIEVAVEPQSSIVYFTADFRIYSRNGPDNVQVRYLVHFGALARRTLFEGDNSTVVQNNRELRCKFSAIHLLVRSHHSIICLRTARLSRAALIYLLKERCMMRCRVIRLF